MKFPNLVLVTTLAFGLLGVPDSASARPHYSDWSGLRICARADKHDPAQPKNNSPIKLRAVCKPGKEVDLGQVQPRDGHHAIENNYGTTATFDAKRGLEWHVSYDNQPRNRAEQIAHLQELNGDVATAGGTVQKPLSKSGRLRLPTLYEASQLAQDYVEELNTPAEKRPSNPGCTVCAEIWPTPSAPDNCIWTSTADAAQPTTHGVAVCVQEDSSGVYAVSWSPIASGAKFTNGFCASGGTDHSVFGSVL